MTMTENKTSDLRFTINTKTKEGNPMIINIRLNDEGKNGNNDFSITGNTYRPYIKGDYDSKTIDGKRYSFDSGGCIHEDILAVRPDLKLFVDLHLSDSKGVPMYAIDNGYYHLKNSGIDTAKKYLRLTEEESKIIEGSEDKLHFTYLLHSLNIPKRWNEEAKKAIALLEEWTNKTFVDDSKKSNWQDLTEEKINLVETFISEGFYLPENVEQRKQDSIIAKKNQAIEKLRNELNAAIEKERNEYSVKLAVLMADLPLNNFIYYSHTNEGRFNWLDYNKTITEDQFNSFLSSVDYSKLPEGIKFKLGK